MTTLQSLQTLYSFSTFSPQFSHCLDRLIQSDDEDNYLLGLQGSELTRLVDFLDKALGIIPVTEDVSRRCLHKLQAICSHSRILPSSYIISGGLVRVGDYPVASTNLSDVWQGTHGSTKVCIKHPKITIRDRQGTEKAFYKEAVVWKRLKHPNIVPFIGITQDPLQFVSEWMPNGELIEYLGKNPGTNRIGLLSDVAEGLAYLHAKHTIHGDLKGSNVLISRGGRARLTDFGFTSVARGLNSVLVSKVQGFTPRWAAPEVIKGGEGCTQEADIYAFGMVVIEVFTGTYPFPELTDPVAVLKIMEGERPDRPREQDLTNPVWDTTVRCWQEDPVLRPRMKEVAATLHECLRLPVSAAQPPILSDPGQQDLVSPGPGVRPPTVGSSGSFPSLINQPGVSDTFQEKEAALPERVSLELLFIEHSPSSWLSCFSVKLKYGNTSFQSAIADSMKRLLEINEWCLDIKKWADLQLFWIKTDKGHHAQSISSEVYMRTMFGLKLYATGNFSLLDCIGKESLPVEHTVLDGTGFLVMNVKLGIA